MKRSDFLFLLSILLCALVFYTLNAQCGKTVQKKAKQGVSLCPHAAPMKPFIRKTNPLPRKEQLERLMSKSKEGSGEYLAYLQEREEIALSEVHETQKFLLDERADRTPKKKKEKEELLKAELQVLSKPIQQMEDFPFADKMDNIRKLVWDIKYGKIQFEDCKGKTNSRILRKIQDAQVKSLKNFHRHRTDYIKQL